jgi:hypothetical protein
MKPRDLVEVAWETPLGKREWRQAVVLCAMPRLLIVEYQDGKRHCLPMEAVRPVLVDARRLQWPVSLGSS